jgi:hypothetical protein
LILTRADSIDLYSLEPSDGGDPGGRGKRLHGWLILGKTTVNDAATRAELLEQLEKGIADPDKGGAKCFDPRHAIRAEYGGTTVDLLICFECGWVYVYVDGKQQKQEMVRDDIQPTFDKVLTKGGVPLAKKRKSTGATG